MFAIYGLMGKMIGSMQKDITEHPSKVTIVDATEEFKSVIEYSGFSENADINYIDSAAYGTDKDAIVDNIKNGNAATTIPRTILHRHTACSSTRYSELTRTSFFQSVTAM